MAGYQCYFVRVDRAPTFEAIECDQDGEAITRATALLDTKAEHWGVEIWKDALLLARVSRGRSSEHQQRAA